MSGNRKTRQQGTLTGTMRTHKSTLRKYTGMLQTYAKDVDVLRNTVQAIKRYIAKKKAALGRREMRE